MQLLTSGHVLLEFCCLLFFFFGEGGRLLCPFSKAIAKTMTLQLMLWPSRLLEIHRMKPERTYSVELWC